MDENGIFENPQTLQIFLYCLRKGTVSVRETQRALGISSPSSVHWHMGKLLDSRLVGKTRDNRYSVTERGRGLRKVSVPLHSDFLLVRGVLVPPLVFNLSFLLTSVLLSGLLWWWSPRAAPYFLMMVVLVEVVWSVRQVRTVSTNSRIT